MESVNFVILGDQEIATDFGKKGTSTDLTLFDRKESEKIYTFVDESRLDLMIKGTVLEGYKKIEQDKIKEELANFAVEKKDGSTSIVIDHTFDVKGVGTVALGKVLSGKITQYDKINHYPSEIEAMVKSIQMHDDDVKESVSPARVGLSLKNIKHDEITRGDVLSNDPSIKLEVALLNELCKSMSNLS